MSSQNDQATNENNNDLICSLSAINTKQPNSSNYGSISSNVYKLKKAEPLATTTQSSTSMEAPSEIRADLVPPPKPAVRQRQSHQRAATNGNNIIRKQSSTSNESRDQAPAATSETIRTKFDAVQQELVQFNRSKSLSLEKEDNDRANAPTAAKAFLDMIVTCEPSSKQPAKASQQLLTLANNNGALKSEQQDEFQVGDKNMMGQMEGEPDKLLARSYPKKVLFIVANEFCERFSYYGLRTVLVLYFSNVLGFSDSSSTVSFHLFATLCYLTTILGAIMGDSVWGKFKTVLYFSLIYLFGEIILVSASIYWNYGNFSVFLTFSGLFMIGLGTGGMKPCIGALGGDQFLPHENKWRESFFSLFYAAINLGSLFSMFLTPMLRSNFQCVNRTDCFPYAFGLPCILMFSSIVIFMMAKNQYTIVALPEQNVILAFFQCVWLASRRKFTSRGQARLISLKKNNKHPSMTINAKQQESESVSTSNSSLACETSTVLRSQAKAPTSNHLSSNLSNSEGISIKPGISKLNPKITENNNETHWLYLASDRFDSKSIEDFRCVLGILLLFLPLPIYWCLFDQQSSLWTLQASRMDGSVLKTGFILEPDQMNVANPLLMIACIPIFQLIIYPTFDRYKILRTPIKRMTCGGLVAALAFVVSALIEIRIQDSLPKTELALGEAHLLLINGLTDCTITNPTISAFHSAPVMSIIEAANNNLTNTHNINTTQTANSTSLFATNETVVMQLNSLDPLETSSIQLNLNLSSSLPSKLAPANYHFRFKLSDKKQNFASFSGCPFDPKLEHLFTLGPVDEKSIKLLYIEQGNGKLSFKVFDESLALPVPGKARVRLLYESFGSLATAERRSFYLSRPSETTSSKPTLNSTQHSDQIKLTAKTQSGQVFLTGHIDVDVPSKGATFSIDSNDNLLTSNKNLSSSQLTLNPGTRNLIIVHQKDSSNAIMRHEVLQDNSYRISMLYQLIPYLMISVSEVMFSITGLEFSYSMAPEKMKSIILAAWLLNTAFGNLLTVVVESFHLFSNVAHDFLFYAALMAVDSILFGVLGYFYKGIN